MSHVPEEPAHFPLLALPDPCLLAVLQCCAAKDPRSLFSAARAHSRLHKAAVLAVSSVSTTVRQQQQSGSVLLYLDRHGSHVNRLKLSQPEVWWQGKRPTLRHLPSTLQLHSLELVKWFLQLLPGNGTEGVLGAALAAGAPPLKRLHLDRCKLLDGLEVLEAALLRLPALEHLCLRGSVAVVELQQGFKQPTELLFPTAVLQQLQQLTYLELAGVELQGPDPASPALQLLTVLTRLADLRVRRVGALDELCITASMLSGMCHLTWLALKGVGFEPAALAGKTKLQHLELMSRLLEPSVGAAQVAQLLSQLQQQTQLTHLTIEHIRAGEVGSGDPAAYTALTASSKLQHLNISWSELPANVWQYLFPTGRQLPHLTSLNVSYVRQLPGGAAVLRLVAPESSRIVSCCPSLESLNMCSLRYSPQQLTQLQGLSRLHTLHIEIEVTGYSRGNVSAASESGEILQAVAQLSGLRKLELRVYDVPTRLLVTQLQQLQQLPHLTALQYSSEVGWREVTFKQTVSCSPLVCAKMPESESCRGCCSCLYMHLMSRCSMIAIPAWYCVQSASTLGDSNT
jgi:hypothetical protein